MVSIPSDQSNDFCFRFVVGASATPFRWQFSSIWSRISVTQFVGRSGQFFLKIQVGFCRKSQSWPSGERVCAVRQKGFRSLRLNCENSDPVQQCHTIGMLQTFCSSWNRWWVSECQLTLMNLTSFFVVVLLTVVVFYTTVPFICRLLSRVLLQHIYEIPLPLLGTEPRFDTSLISVNWNFCLSVITLRPLWELSFRSWSCCEWTLFWRFELAWSVNLSSRKLDAIELDTITSESDEVTSTELEVIFDQCYSSVWIHNLFLKRLLLLTMWKFLLLL